MSDKNSEINRLIDIVDLLRSENGCPWDKEQTSESLIPFFIEEVYEAVECIEQNNDDLKEELGDVLLHIVFQSSIANEKGYFNFNDVLKNINNKLIKRHPHIFNDGKEKISFDKKSWELNKQKSKNRASILDGTPISLPSIIKSQRLQEKASSVGFDWDNINDVWAKLYEEIDELKIACEKGQLKSIEEEIGDCFFSLVNLARHLNISAENSVRKTNNKFSKRFKEVEHKVSKMSKKINEMSNEEISEIWESVK